MKKPENKGTNTKNVEAIKLDSYNVTRASMINDTVFFDVVLNGISIYGCKVVEGKNGDFISFPSRKGKDDKYYSIAWCRLSDDDQKLILDTVEKVLNN